MIDTNNTSITTTTMAAVKEAYAAVAEGLVLCHEIYGAVPDSTDRDAMMAALFEFSSENPERLDEVEAFLVRTEKVVEDWAMAMLQMCVEASSADEFLAAWFAVVDEVREATADPARRALLDQGFDPAQLAAFRDTWDETQRTAGEVLTAWEQES